MNTPNNTTDEPAELAYEKLEWKLMGEIAARVLRAEKWTMEHHFEESWAAYMDVWPYFVEAILIRKDQAHDQFVEGWLGAGER